MIHRQVSLFSRTFYRCYSKSIRENENEKFKRLRIAQLKERSQCGKTTYPHKFEYSVALLQFGEKYSGLKNGEKVEETVSVVGRVQNIRDCGKKLKFVDILQGETKLQIKLKNDDFFVGNFKEDTKFVKRGDIIGIDGSPMRTDAGELSILAQQIHVLTPIQAMMPSGVLERTEGRYRRRHLDLMMNPQIRQVFRTRSLIIQHVRDFLLARDFMEVETPILINGVGGATATPFRTYHKEMKLDLSLRIAPELHLKMLTIGGFDRVFEIGKQFRNEGIDKNHNPEFTSCEFYMACADYENLMRITEQMLGSLKLTDNIFAKTPFSKMDFVSSLESATGLTFPDDLNNEHDVVPFLRDTCLKHDINPASDAGQESTIAKLYDKLFSNLIESELKDPTFVMHHPTCMSPLAKEHRSKPGISERFELFASGMELVNAYTELNDPEEQRKAFQAQGNQSNPLQQDFLHALDFGLPPTAGWGLGIDRLVMIATKQTSIREVLLFPTSKPLE